MSANARVKVSIADHCLAELKDALGDAVCDDPRPYGETTLGVTRDVAIAVMPRSEDDVVTVVRIAGRHGVPVYPVSTGKNWGYGSAAPAVDACILVDLSLMNAIADFDEELGLVTLQPGVTQGQLAAYLDERGLRFMVPVTGAGPSVSIVGNALDRGYGITPHTDHFAAVMALRAILPDGTTYMSAHADNPATERAYKWGIGPYLDGLFAQGSFGIVTNMTIALARVHEQTELFMLDVAESTALADVVSAVRGLVRDSGTNISGINIMKRERLQAMFPPEQRTQVALPAWMVVGGIYGDAAMVKVMRRRVKTRLAALGKLRLVNERTLRLASALLPLLPRGLRAAAEARVTKGRDLLAILQGRPRTTALALAYPRGVPRANDLDPQRDGCGLAWFSPLVPMKADMVEAYIAFVSEVCAEHGFTPLITLTTISERCFDSTLPIVFDRDRDGARARLCVDALLRRGKELGFVPYRVGIDTMQAVVSSEHPFWNLVDTLKRAVDPSGIMAPGRYAPL